MVDLLKNWRDDCACLDCFILNEFFYIILNLKYHVNLRGNSLTNGAKCNRFIQVYSIKDLDRFQKVNKLLRYLTCKMYALILYVLL